MTTSLGGIDPHAVGAPKIREADPPLSPGDGSARPWVAHYDPGVPATLAPYPDRTLLAYLAEAARVCPDEPAVLFKGARLTWRELARRSVSFAAALADLGVRPGERVALLLPNCPQFLIAQFGAWGVGAVVAPLNPIYTERELAEVLGRLAAETIVTLTPFYERVKAVQPGTTLKRVIATNIKEYLPPATRVLFTLAKERQDGHRVALREGDHRFGDLLREGARLPRPTVPVRPDDPALILQSGGTTGTPKGVVGAHRALVIAGEQVHAWFAPVLTDRRDAIAQPLPLFHVYGNVGGLGVALVGRHPLALIPNPRDLDDLLDTIAKVRPTVFNAVPTLFIALLNHPRVRDGKVDFGSLKLCISGAAALRAETKERFERATGSRVAEGYSTTEALMACAVNPAAGPGKAGSIGLPLPDVEMCIVDAESGETPLPPGEVGELLVRAPQLMAGYWQDPEETARVLRPLGAGGPWLYTGDLGRMDQDGYVFIVDRKKDLIKTSGYQVWPREIEEVIAAHPAVAEVGVVGVADAKRGQVAKAWVVPREGVAVTADEIRAHCRAQLAPYKVPAAVEFRADLPKTLVGKVLRRELRDEG